MIQFTRPADRLPQLRGEVQAPAPRPGPRPAQPDPVQDGRYGSSHLTWEQHLQVIARFNEECG